MKALVRSVGVQNSSPHTLFLGAGASITSGMSSAQECIWDWKSSIYLTENVDLEEQFSEPSLANSQELIQQWLDSKGIKPEGDSDEYSFYIEYCCKNSDIRRAYFQEKVRLAKQNIPLSIGLQLP